MEEAAAGEADSADPVNYLRAHRTDLYELLGVARDAGADKIKAARKQWLRAHLANNNDDEGFHQQRERVDMAMHILLDHDQRALYDQYCWASLHDAHEIVPGLWLGAQELARDGEALQRLGITHTLTVLANWDVPMDCEHKIIEARDSVKEDLLQHFPEAVQFIHTARSSGGVVYVHCAGGVSRSASCVIAYLMAHEAQCNGALSSSYDLVKHKRELIDPNPGFLKQLVVWEQAGCILPPEHLQWLTKVGAEEICQAFGFDQTWWEDAERKAYESLQQRAAKGLV